MKKLSLIIRKITIPPVFAALLLVPAFFLRPGAVGTPLHLALCLFSLAVLPCLAYPLQKYFKHFKDRGREGQRTLAMLFSFLGYMLATVASFALCAPRALQYICLVYLCCGIAMLLFNKGLHLKASGHACGVVGPVLLALLLRMYPVALVGTALILPVFYASVKTKQHTAPQLIGGAAIAATVVLTLAVIYAAL